MLSRETMPPKIKKCVSRHNQSKSHKFWLSSRLNGPKFHKQHQRCEHCAGLLASDASKKIRRDLSQKLVKMTNADPNNITPEVNLVLKKKNKMKKKCRDISRIDDHIARKIRKKLTSGRKGSKILCDKVNTLTARHEKKEHILETPKSEQLLLTKSIQRSAIRSHQM